MREPERDRRELAIESRNAYQAVEALLAADGGARLAAELHCVSTLLLPVIGEPGKWVPVRIPPPPNGCPSSREAAREMGADACRVWGTWQHAVGRARGENAARIETLLWAYSVARREYEREPSPAWEATGVLLSKMLGAWGIDPRRPDMHPLDGEHPRDWRVRIATEKALRGYW